MKKLAEAITKRIQAYNPNLSDLEVIKIKFGLECLFSEASKLFIYLIIFSFFSQTSYFLTAVFFFCILRGFAGGFHEKTYLRCLFTSFFIFAFIVFTATQLSFSAFTKAILAALSILLIWLYAPVDHPNKPIISMERRKKLKSLSVLMAIIFLGISFLLPHKYGQVALIAVLCEAVSLPIGEFSKRRHMNENPNW